MEPEQIVLSSLWRLEAGLAIFFTLVYETSGDHPACSRNLTHSLPDFDASHRTHPNLLIGIGSHKSGSTFLHHVLSMHPQIVPAKEKELFTFRKPGFQPSNESYDEYLDNWKEWLGKKNHPDGAVLMEFTPTYITEPVAPCHIKQMFPKAKFIVTMREPVSRALSAVGMMRRHCSRREKKDGNIWPGCCEEAFKPVVPKLRAALKTLESFKEECLDPDAQDPWWRCPLNDTWPLERGLYAVQIAWWFKFFDPSQFIFVSNEALYNDPHTQVDRVLRFVGVDLEWDKSINISMLRDNVAHVTFDEPGMDEIKERLRALYMLPNELLYRLLSMNGHEFPPFTDNGQTFATERMSLEEGAALCCYGMDYDRGRLLSHQSYLSQFCRKQPTIIRKSSQHWKWFWLLLAIIGVVLICTWKSMASKLKAKISKRTQHVE